MPDLNAEIISVGTELLLGQIVDTHAATMAQILAECGIGCRYRQTVGDNLERAVEAIRLAMSRADIVITIGGLGPTQDDLTRPAVAQALGDKLIREPEMESRLKGILAKRRLRWMDSIGVQADRPESARFIENGAGTAPGLVCEKNGKAIVSLPGPRAEFDLMARGPVRYYLKGRAGDRVIHSHVLRVCGLGESWVEKEIAHLMQAGNPTVAPYAKTGEVHLRLTARAASIEEAEAITTPVSEEIRRILGDAVYGVDDQPLEETVLADLKERRQTVAVAESLTGGGLAHRLTSVPGSSDAFLGGIVAYDVGVKKGLLGVSAEIVDRSGQVSAECAQAMAERIRSLLGSTFGVSITGNAGPTSDTDGKPVGLVFIGVASPSGAIVDEQQYRSTREDIRNRAIQEALVTLRKAVRGK